MNLLNKNHRKSIIPSSHLPTNSNKLFKMDNEQDNSLIETEKQTRSNINSTSTTHMNENYDNNDILMSEKIENNINQEENEGENNFDSFNLENFTRFFGEQEVNVWLNETVKKFNRLLIPQNLRFTAIALLVEGPAQKVYIRNRRHVRSFDDFLRNLISTL